MSPEKFCSLARELVGLSVPGYSGCISACDRPMRCDSVSGCPGYAQVYIVTWHIVYQLAEHVLLSLIVPHGPVKVGFDTLS